MFRRPGGDVNLSQSMHHIVSLSPAASDLIRPANMLSSFVYHILNIGAQSASHLKQGQCLRLRYAIHADTMDTMHMAA